MERMPIRIGTYTIRIGTNTYLRTHTVYDYHLCPSRILLLFFRIRALRFTAFSAIRVGRLGRYDDGLDPGVGVWLENSPTVLLIICAREKVSD
jgi:hypothetical protein